MGTVRKKHIPNLLRKHRKLSGFKQNEVAEMLELKNVSMISRWENGAAAPSLLYLLKLSIIYATLCDQLYPELRNDLRKEIIDKKEKLIRSRKKL
jgi:transcriptional regulator with XRE-family HTH domain